MKGSRQGRDHYAGAPGWSYAAGRSQGRPGLAVIFVIQVVEQSQVEAINYLGSLARRLGEVTIAFAIIRNRIGAGVEGIASVIAPAMNQFGGSSTRKVSPGRYKGELTTERYLGTNEVWLPTIVHQGGNYLLATPVQESGSYSS